MRQSFFLLAAFAFLMACQPADRVFIEHQELSTELEWRREDTRTFQVPVENIKQDYKLLLGFRYGSGFPYQYAKVKVIEESPSGDKTENIYSLKVRSDNGDYIGEPGFNIWDSEHLVEGQKTYGETGTYKYTVSHAMEKEVMPMAMEISLILDKKTAE